tara:strand:+ start:37 stop:1251 length:1215 start_codon:yes stop_codon:yes gene_type:complete
MTRKGVWNLQQVRDKYLQELWEYNVNLFSWGNNDAGQLGINDTTNRSSPTQIPGDNWQISGTGNNESRNIGIMDSTYSIKSDGTLWAWGEGAYGALGQNNQTNQSSPIQIGSDTTWSSVGGGYRHGTAVKTDGTLWSWGYNYHGLLGQNNETHYSSPVQVGSDTNWSSVASGNVYTYGRKTDGTLWAWGNNTNGTLGQNLPQNANRSSPVQIPGTNWSEQYCSNQSTVTAIKTDGTLWAWGRNWEGQLGQSEGQNKAKSSPVQIPGNTWAILARGSGERTRNPIAVKTDGTLWTWGANEQGQLGQNHTNERSSPVQVGTDTTWSTTIRPAGTGYSRLIACIKSDNTLWAWGQNSSGSFGVGEKPATLDYRSSPVQVPGTTWNEIYMTGNYSVFGIKPNLTPSQL